MGWVGREITAFETPKSVGDSDWNQGKTRVLKSFVDDLEDGEFVYYAAIENSLDDGSVEVFAAITIMLLDDGWISTKEMTEHYGPVASNPPKEILDLLTPLPKDGSELAREWRQECYENLGIKLPKENPLKPV